MKRILHASLRVKLTVFVTAVVAVTAGTLGVIGYRVARDILVEQIHDRLFVLRADRQNMLLDYVQTHRQFMQLVADRAVVRELLGAYGAGRLAEAAVQEQLRPVLQEVQRSTKSFQAVWVTDAKGRVIAATQDNFLWKEFAPTAEFQQGRERSHMGLFSLAHGMYQVVAAAPVRGPDGMTLGVAMALLSAQSIVEHVADATGLGETGEVLVGRREGNSVYYMVPPRLESHLTDVTLADAPALAAASSGQSGFMQTTDPRRGKVLAAYGPVGYDDWGIVVQLDAREAYQSIGWLKQVITGLTVVWMLIGAWAAHELARRITDPILRMAQMAESIASGTLDARLEVSTQDEVGKLGTSFNQMAEALKQSYDALEQRVRERTAALTQERHLLQSLMDQLPDMIYFKDRASRFLRINRALAQRFGLTDPQQAVGKTDYDYFTREHAEQAFKDEQWVITTGLPLEGKEEKETWPDGHQTWVSTTKVPFRDEAGHVIGTFGISHDITQRKEAEQQLALYAREIAQKNRQIEEDLAMAREVQQAFLPQRYPVFPPGVPVEQSALRFCHSYHPASTLAGDFCEIVPLSDTATGVFICDVMGHGVRSALVMAVIRGLVDELKAHAHDPSRFLAEINRALVAHWNLATTTVFATACFVVVDAATGTTRCGSAGHPDPLWIRRRTGQAEYVLQGRTNRGPALGLIADAVYPSIEFTMAEGDGVLLYTDGLYEVKNAEGEQYGLTRLRETVVGMLDRQCDEVQGALVAAAKRHSASGELTDDVCLLAVQLARRLSA